MSYFDKKLSELLLSILTPQEEITQIRPNRGDDSVLIVTKNIYTNEFRTVIYKL